MEALRKLGTNTLYAILALILITIIFYNWVDVPTIYWVRKNVNTPVLIHLAQLCQWIFSVVHWLAMGVLSGLVGLYFKFAQKNPKRAKAWFFFTTVIFTAFLLTFVTKFICARYRPIELLHHGVYGFHYFSHLHVLNSMPSGHAAMAFSACYAISRMVRQYWATIAWFIVALLITLSRLIILAHYPSDLIVGAVIGIMSVIWIAELMHYHTDS